MTIQDLANIKEILEDNYHPQLAEDIINCIVENMTIKESRLDLHKVLQDIETIWKDGANEFVRGQVSMLKWIIEQEA